MATTEEESAATIEQTLREKKLNEEMLNLQREVATLSGQELRKARERISYLEKEIEFEKEMTLERLSRIEILRRESSTWNIFNEEKRKKQIELAKLELEHRRKTSEMDDRVYKQEKQKIVELEKQLLLMTKINKTIDAMSAGLYTKIQQSLFSVNGIVESIGMNFSSILEGNAEYARVTGQIAERTAHFGAGMSQFGIGFAEMNKASMELFTSFSGFSDLGVAARDEITATTAKLGNLGVAAQVAGKNLDDMTKGLGMSAQAAAMASEDIAKHAIGAGIAVSKMTSDFAAAMPKLAAYGANAVGEFIRLEKQAKSLGIEVSRLMGIVGDTFDTFDGAAKAAGGLNAVLGGNYLNSVQMLNATESERILLLNQAIEASGRNFSSLGKYEQKAIAARVGITDLNEANKLFGKSSTQLAIDMEKEAASQEKLQKVQAEAADTMKQLKLAFNEILVVLKPVIEWIRSIITKFSEWNDKLHSVPAFILVLIGSLGFLGSILLSFIGKIGSAIMALRLLGGGMASTAAAGPAAAGSLATVSTASSTVATTSGPAAAGIRAIGSALSTLATASVSMPVLLVLAGVFLSIGGAVAIAAYGISLIVKSFALLNGDQISGAAKAILYFTGAITVLSLALVALAFSGASKIAAGVMLAFGGSFLLISVSILIASKAIVNFNESLSSLFVQFNTEKIESLYKFGKAIMFISAAMTMATGGAILNKFSSLFGISGIDMMVSAIEKIGEALDSLPENKTIALTSLTEALNVSKNVTEAQLKPTTDFIQVVKQYYEVQATSKSASDDAVVAAIREAVTMNQQQQQQNQQPFVINVMLDGKMLKQQKVGQALNDIRPK